jgi:hypothetical protein
MAPIRECHVWHTSDTANTSGAFKKLKMWRIKGSPRTVSEMQESEAGGETGCGEVKGG